MYALPDQQLSEAVNDLEQALSFGTTHISLYHLTLEPNTLFAKYPPSVPDDDSAFDMQDALLELLNDRGFDRYEVSAFSKPGQRCQHNLNYWSFGDYIGIGAGAHGKISFPDKVIRTIKERHPENYMRKILEENSATIEERVISAKELPFEFMLNALRLTKGIPSEYFAERTGLGMSSISSKLKIAVDKGLLESNPAILAPTPLGLQYLNDLQEIFLA
jgi:oxygen-independent coproporphyrinogen-3 oxidase